MTEPSLNVLAVVGSLQRASVTRVVVRHVAQQLQAAGCSVDVLDFAEEPLALYNPPQRLSAIVATEALQRGPAADNETLIATRTVATTSEKSFE